MPATTRPFKNNPEVAMLPLPLPQLVRYAHHDHTLACQRSEPTSLCDLGLTRTPAERGLPLLRFGVQQDAGALTIPPHEA